MTIRSGFSLLSKIVSRHRFIPKSIILTQNQFISISSPSPFLNRYSRFPPYYASSFSHFFSTDRDFESPQSAADDSMATQSEFVDSVFDVGVRECAYYEDSIFPVRALISLLDGYHDLTGFPWWVIITSSVFAFRIALIPLIVLQLTKLQQIFGFLPKLPPPFPPPFSGKSYIKQLSLFFEKRKAIDCPSLLWLPVGLSQIPFFILGVATIRLMASNGHPGFENGGALWFQDLTQLPSGLTSPAFPLLIAGFHLTNTFISFNKFRNMTDEMSKVMRSFKFLIDGMVLPIFFVGFFVPQGSLVYWVTNSAATFIQHFFLSNAGVRNYFGLPLKDGTPLVTAKDQNTPVVVKPGVNIVDSSTGKVKKVSVESLSPKELVNLSIQMLAKGNKQGAVPLLRLALNKDPKHIRSLIVLGQTLLQDGLPAEAVEYLDRAVSNILSVGPPSKVEEVDQLILASMWCGVAYIRNGRNAEGIPHLERIGYMTEPADAKSKAHYYDGLLMLASALLNEDRKPEAEKYLRKAARYSSAYNVYLEQLQNEDDQLVGDLVNKKSKDG